MKNPVKAWALVALVGGAVGCPGSPKTGAPAVKSESVVDAKSGEAAKSGELAPEKTGEAEPEEPGQEPAAGRRGVIEIVRTFEGRVNVSPPGLGSGGSPTRVIRSPEELESFRGSIPKKQIQKKQPAPPSDDPLLGDPGIDFTTHVLVIVQRRDTMYIHPTVDRVEAHGEGAQVVYSYPPLGDSAMAAAVMDVGTYCGVVIPKVAGKISFERSPGAPEPAGPGDPEVLEPETGEEEH